MVNKKIKVIFVLPSLVPGGAEKIMSFVAQNLNKELFEAKMWIIGKSSGTDYELKNIELRYFNLSRVLKAFLPLVFALIKERPKYVICSLTHLNILMGFISVLFPRIKFIGRESNVLSAKSKFSQGKRPSLKRMLRFAYSRLDLLICQSNDMKEDLLANYSIEESKLTVINNPITKIVDLPERKYPIDLDKKPIKFITVASLKKQKGHLRMLEALSLLDIKFRYTMIGDGPESDIIKKYIKELNLTENVLHIPFTDNVENYLAESDFFLQGAYTEGFPNCLLESCVTGLPIIAYNAPGGLNEIIKEGFNGFLAKDDEDFRKNIELAIQHSWCPEEISKDIIARYNKNRIINKYENAILNT